MDVVEGAFQNFALGRIAVVVQDDHNRCLFVAHGRRELRPGHLKGAVSHQHDRPQRRVGETGADGGRNREPHRRVVGGGQKLEAPVHVEIDGSEEGFTHIGDDESFLMEHGIEVTKHSLQTDGSLRRRHGVFGLVRRRQLRGWKRRQ